MKTSPEAVPAEPPISEILDALEAGLLSLRRERDELRQTLAGAVVKPAARKAVKKAAKKKKKAARKAAPAKAVAKQATPAQTTPAKTRQALGRGLSQIRPTRPPNS